MKRLLPFLLTLLFFVGFSLDSSAKFSIGPRVGLNVNNLKFEASTFNAENRLGYNAGIEVEYIFPVANVGFDLSVMYARQNSNLPWEKNEEGEITTFKKDNNDYIEIPLNLKWKISIPVVDNIVTPYVFTGPSVAFLAKKKSIQNAWGNFKRKSLDTQWNFGFGVQLFKKLQIGASYGLGLSSVLERVDSTVGTNLSGDEPVEKIYDPKNRTWTISAAFLF